MHEYRGVKGYVTLIHTRHWTSSSLNVSIGGCQLLFTRKLLVRPRAAMPGPWRKILD